MSDTEERTFVPFEQRPEWADVAPLPQDEGLAGFVTIRYAPEFAQTMNMFRAVLQRCEMSERALALTAAVVELNPANYTAWQFRRRLLKHLGTDLREELAYTSALCEKNEKNYQIWFHRRALVDQLGDASGELAFTEKMLEEDSKNYHAWSHRQWAIATFGLWDGELAFTETLIADDIRNNSAWNQRFFVVSHLGFSDERVAAEAAFAAQNITLAPKNESPWSYLRGLVAANSSVIPAARATAEAHQSASIHAASLMLDLAEQEGDMETASACCKTLLAIDPIRQKYWAHRHAGVVAAAAAIESA
eukprot:TRINITY_DN5003_c0_g1_i2.p1 TRINITY_DN5003_c0_g1~~TRINITY_DN5003_c0_g1_i2.p1  ORF type:complete len:305 (-),score=69.44 TRINITY_DN5003_c0_g1_i2:24-938(-)